ncbi:hypothetical protein D9M69_477320 [compost metagenome]
MLVSACAAQALTSGGCGPGMGASERRPISSSTGLPVICCSVARRISRSLCAAISVEVARSKRACASLASTMVAVPTSKLRLACSSCSPIAFFCARARYRLSCAASTSK